MKHVIRIDGPKGCGKDKLVQNLSSLLSMMGYEKEDFEVIEGKSTERFKHLTINIEYIP